MKKHYNGPYGHTYYYRNDVLVGHPTNADGTCDFGLEQETPVAEFAEPLTPQELQEVKDNL